MRSGKRLHIAWDPVYAHPLPAGHRFPMLKYELIPEQLLYEGTIDRSHLFAPAACTQDIILHTHTREYLHKLIFQQLTPTEQRRIGFPQSPGLIDRELVITGGTVACCDHAFENGVALNSAGGTHHAFADRGEGFCLLNDFAVAANFLLTQKRVSKILIVDLDVHQGNGTAKIFEDEPAVFTFSMHGKHNYPFHKERSDCDVALNDGIDNAGYLERLRQYLPKLIGEHQPEIVFYLSGVDILDSDRFGKLKISIAGCRQRDEYVFSLLQEKNIPVVVAMGGGYSDDIKVIVEAHCNTFRVAKDIYGLD